MDDKTWKRLDDETNPSYHAFHKFFLSQDPPRSLAEAYRRHRFAKGAKKVPNGPPGTWQKWYRIHNWNARAIDYDDHLFEIDQEQLIHDRRKVKKRLTKVSSDMLKKLEEMCKFPVAEIIRSDDGGGTTIIKPAGWKLSDITRFSKAVREIMESIDLLEKKADVDIDQKVIIEVVGNVSLKEQK